MTLNLPNGGTHNPHGFVQSALLASGEHQRSGSSAANFQGAEGASSPQRDDAGLHMPIRVYAMLPLDTVNSESVFKAASARWFKQALTVLAASGVHGVAVDVWWGAVERLPGVYSWAGYQQLVQLVKEAGLKMQAVMSFHACGGNVGDTAHIGLPPWVLQCGEQDPDLFYTDKPRGGLGQRNKEYISIWSSEERLLYGRTAYECYEDFMIAFKEAFKEDLGSTVEELVIGTGPCGELRYPSYPERHGWRFPGIGEFQCYDRRALASLAAAASAAGHPEWGYGGPHDAGHYNSTPEDTGFFSFSGSWDTSYGRFFLSWYSDCLLRHGERLLKLANRAFASVTGSGNGRTFSTALSERSSRGNTEAAASQLSPSQSGAQPAGAAALPAGGADRMVLHPPPQPAAAGQGAGQAAGAASREQLQGMRAQEGSPTALQQPGSCAMSSHGSVQSSTNLCESLHSNTPTSGSTVPLVHEPGLTSSSSSNYLCDPGVDVVGVVRGGGVGKAGAANGERGRGSGRSWQPQLGGEAVPSTPPVHDLAVAAADGGPRPVAESVMVTASPSQRMQPPPPQHSSQAAPWLGLSQQPIPGIVLPTPGYLSVQPQLSYSGNGSLLSPSFNPGQSGSAGGLMSPSFHLHQNGSSGGLVSPNFQPAHSGMHSAPSMTLVASGSSNLPSNAASLCGSEGTPSQTLYSSLVGNSAASAPPRASPRMHHSDLSGSQQPQHQLQLLEQLQERSRQATGRQDVAKPLPRFMSCQTIALCNGAPSEEAGRRPVGSGPSLAALSHPQQNLYGLTVTASNDGLTTFQPGTAANGPTGEQAAGSQGTGSTPVASPSTPTTSCGEHMAPPLSECSGPGNSPPTNAPLAIHTPTVTANANALNDLNRSVGQLSISSTTSISTQTSLAVESESDARQQPDNSNAPSSQVRTHGSAPAAISTAAEDAQQQAPRRPSSRPLDHHAVTLSLKIAGVHWWFRSRSHAAELTAGYYNTATHDGYAGLVELCARHGAALTLTCVEMCDGQHPAAAACGPEGLLKQVRALTARHGVSLSGENALPIFLGHGVDTVALERVVINTRAWYGPRAFTTAARQHAYLLALQQHSQMPHASLSMPLHALSNYTPPNGSQQQQQQQASPNGSGQQQHHQGPYGSHTSYPPYTAAGWGDAGTQQAYSSNGLPPSQGGVPNHVHDTLMGRSVSDTGQLLYFQQFQQAPGAGPKLNGGSQPSSHEPSMHGGHSVLGMLGGGDYGQAGASAMRQIELRSSPQIPDHASSLLLDGGSAGGGGPGSGAALLAPARAASVGGASGMVLDLPGEQRGVAACGLRIDSYADIVDPLPAMRSFTFLRLGPELLLTGYQAPWIRFMTGMQQGGYAPC